MAQQPPSSEFLLQKPDYWEEACTALSDADPIMRDIILRYPAENLRSRGDPFGTLLRSIVGQQISTKAADAIWGRLTALVPSLSPEAIQKTDKEALRTVGLSGRKVEYVLDLCGHFKANRINPKTWHKKEDDEVIHELTQIRGVGRWTAEMVLIFSLMRPDVLPVDDMVLRRSAAAHYRQDFSSFSPAVFRKFGERWAPWRTVASWYLWRTVDDEVIEY